MEFYSQEEKRMMMGRYFSPCRKGLRGLLMTKSTSAGGTKESVQVIELDSLQSQFPKFQVKLSC